MSEDRSFGTNQYGNSIPLIAEIEEWFDEEVNFGSFDHVELPSKPSASRACEKTCMPPSESSKKFEFDYLVNGPASVRSSVSSNSSVDDVFEFDMPETPAHFSYPEEPPRSVSSVSTVDDVFDFDFNIPSQATLDDLSLELGIDLCSEPSVFEPLVPPAAINIAISPVSSPRQVIYEDENCLPISPTRHRLAACHTEQDEVRPGLRKLLPRSSSAVVQTVTVKPTLHQPQHPASTSLPLKTIWAGPQINPNQTAKDNGGCIFTCTECGKGYPRRDAMRACSRSHRLTSKSLKTLQRRTCTICKKICSSPVSLKTHMLIHSGEKPFKCFEPDCTKACREKSALKKHYKRFHPDKMESFETQISVHSK